MKKRILSLLLALTMLVSMLPVQALAEDAPEAPTAPETTAATEAPTIPETTAATEAPTVPETTAATEAPTIPETTAATEAPTVPETTAETEVPVESTVEATESAMTVMSVETNTCGENLAWEVENGTLTIYATAEEFGEIEDYAKGEAPWYSQRDSITTVDMQAGYGFGSGAFYGLSQVTLVKLPQCLVHFENAFEGCTSLVSFCFPQGNESGFAVDFYGIGDDGLAYGSEIVDESASDGSRRLCALAPAAEPFANYTAWFQYINTGALRGCKVTDLVFRMDVTVDYNAFINCESLETVTVYSSATFADSVFVGCTGLQSINFESDAPRLSANAFSGLDGVTINYYSGTDGWDTVAGQNYGGTNITWNAIEPASEGTCGENLSWSFNAGTGVLSIDAVDAAQDCGGITAYDYGEAPWYRYRDQITSIDMNAGLYIGGFTIFADLENVTHVDLPRDLVELSSDDFSPMYNLTSIAFPEGNDNGFSVVDETSVIKTEGDKVTLITTAKGAPCTIPGSVTTIGAYALGMRYIEDTLEIPATVTELEDYALYQCSVTTIRFTGNAPTIGENAFDGVSANVIYPANDETWTDDVTANMYGGALVWVKEGETPTRGVCGLNLLWEFDAESGCLTISATDPGDIAYMDSYAEGEAPWYVYRESITEVVLNSCRNIGENAFYGLSELTTFWLSSDLEEIGAGAFAGCTQLSSFWGESTVYYGAGATILQKTASFGPLVVVVSPGAGETLNLPGQTSAILPGALAGCDSIRTITFPDTFRHLQEGALNGCNSDLTLIFRGFEPPYIEKLAFAGLNITVNCPVNEGWRDMALAGDYGASSITWPEDLFSGPEENHNYCGEDLAWKIEDGTLIIYPVLGTGGNMDSYGTASGESTVSSYALTRSGESSQAPWYDQRESITAIDMQGGITIGAHAFDGLSNVTTVNLPKSLMYFTGSFGECTSLTTFVMPESDYGYSVVDGGKAIVREDLDLINLYAVVPTVEGDYTVPEDVQAIHYGAFAGCTGINKVTFPAGLVLVCGDALTGCGDGTEFVFTGDAPEMEENAFDGLTDVTVTYPGDADGWEEIIDNFGENITFENAYAVALDESNPTTLLAGKSATLKASLSPSNLTSTSIVWSLKNAGDSEFATLSASGKLTAKAAITQKHEIVVVAASKDGKATPAEYTVTLIPKADSVSVSVNGEDATNGECYIDLNDTSRPDSYTFRADIAPADAGQAVTWKVSDTKGTYVTYEEVENEDGTTDLVVKPAAAGMTGTVAVTATANDGSGRTAKVTLRIAKLAQDVHILKENVPGYDEQTDTIHVCGGGKIVLTTDVAANKELTDRTILWSLDDDSIPYASISTNGTLTTYPVSAPTTIVVTAAVKANPTVADSVEITLHPAVDSVTITPNEAQMEALDYWDITNGTIDFDAVCFPEGAMTDGEWSVSSTKLATIDKDTGVLTPLNAGKVKVTFKTTDGSKKQATVQVTIVKPVCAVTVEAVNLPDDGILYSGQTLSLKATTWADEACKIPATNQKVYWNVLERYTDENGDTWEWLSTAATISSSGKLTAKAVADNVQVYAVAASVENGILGEIPLTIQPKQENTLAITIGGSTLDENGEVISYWFRPMGNQEWMQPGESYEIGGAWFNRTSEVYTPIPEGCTITSSNAKVASIDNGILNIVAPGTTKLTAKCLGEDGKMQTATAVLTVRYYVDHVTIAEPDTLELRSGKSLSLKASVWADEDGTIQATNQKVWWEIYEVVTDPETGEIQELIYGSDAATISSSGKLTAKNVTENVTVRVYASSQDDYWTDNFVDITIRPKQEYQTSIYQNEMKCSGTVNVPVNLLEDGKLPASEFSVRTYVSVPGSAYDGTYVSGEVYGAGGSSSNPKVADFDENGNLVFTGTLGSTTITAAGTLDGQAVSAKVTLKAVNAVEDIAVKQKVDGQKLYSGKSINLTAIVDSDATNKKVTWVSSDPSIATVSTSGQVKAGKVYEQKQVTIYAEAQDGFGASGEITLSIYPMATTVSIMSGERVMNNRVETISVGETVELTAVVYPIGEASSGVKWTPASNAVVDVTVGEDGVVTITAKKKGTVTIKAAAQDGSGKSASFKLTVNP